MTAAILSTSSDETVAIDAGASSAFSCRRDAVTTTGLRISAWERSGTSTSTEAPTATLTSSMRFVS